MASSDPSGHILCKNPKRWGIALVACAVTALVLFRLYPEIDLSASERYFVETPCEENDVSKSRCGIFPFESDPVAVQFREIGLKLPQLFGLFALIYLVWISFSRKHKTVWKLMVPAHGLVSLLLGPVIFANLILKPLWGRPRPDNVVEFGGDFPYMLAGDISRYCTSNCSFVSGEATAAFWMLWIVPCLPPPWRWPAGILLFLIACAISWLRVAFGAHFLSDVTMGAFVALIAILLSAVLLQSAPLVGWFKQRAAYLNGKYT